MFLTLSLAASYPSPAKAWGGCIGDPRSPSLNTKNADASHRLCAKRRSGGGVDLAEAAPHRSSFSPPPMLASPTSTLPTRGREKKRSRSWDEFASIHRAAAGLLEELVDQGLADA